MTIDQFQPGRLYALRVVAALFGCTDDTVKNRVKAGLLTAVKPVGSTHHFFDGAEVLRYWRACGLSAVPVPLPPTPAEQKRRREAALKSIGC